MAGEIVGGDLHRRLGVRIPLDGTVHAGMQLHDIAREHGANGGRKVTLDDEACSAGALAEIAAELAGPILEGGGFAPSAEPGCIGELDKHVTPDRLGLAGPFVLTPRGQCHVDKLYLFDWIECDWLPRHA